jgi:hypothetical protein
MKRGLFVLLLLPACGFHTTSDGGALDGGGPLPDGGGPLPDGTAGDAAVGDGAVGDSASGSDAASPITLHGTDPVTVHELDLLSVTISAVATDGTTVTLSTGTLPAGAQLDPASGKLTWTPAIDQAGDYAIEIDADAASGAHARQSLVVHVLNGVDEVVIARPALVGDFDHDGFADLASCSGPSAGSYQITILYGDATGLPATGASGRTATYTLPVASGAGCGDLTGADLDGDQHADVIMLESDGTHVLALFGAPRATVPATLALPSPGGLVLNRVLVLDFDGDGVDDLAATAPPVTTFVWLGTRGRRTAINPLSHVASESTACNALLALGAGDIDGDHRDDLLVYDPALGSTPSDGCSTKFSGARVLFGGATSPIRTASYVRPPSDYLFGLPGTLCDVDHDGFADWVAVDQTNALFFFGSASGLGASSPVSVANAPVLSPSQTTDIWAVSCARGVFGPSTVLFSVISPGMPIPGSLSMVLGGSRTPTIDRVVTPIQSTETNFGVVGDRTADVNGDQHADLLVTSEQRAWIFYGR